MPISELRDLIARQRSGWSLEQPFYLSPEIYELERRSVLADQWYILGHGSEVAEPGMYIVRELLGESLIIVRGKDKVVRGFYNVCRHRGSQICDRDGKGTSFTCPYHAWTYRLDGSLRSAPAMSETVDLSQLGLHAAPVREIGGVILGSSQGDIRSLDEAQKLVEPMLSYQGIPQARIAARRSYPTKANWKLVMENFEECYHCLPSHPEYISVMKYAQFGEARESTPEEMAVWDSYVESWFRDEANPESPAKIAASQCSNFRVTRAPIGKGMQTTSDDGTPVAPLMGQVPRFDGGGAWFTMRPFVRLNMLNDHAIMLQFLPTGPESTDVILTWLVDGSAKDSEVDVARTMWLWDVTTKQDKEIVERNARGVHSRAYGPGPYSNLEDGTVNFVNGYLQGIQAYCNRASG